MKLNDFDYELPEALIAQHPARRRDESRLMLLDRTTGEVRETRFSSFPRYLREGDLLVLNESEVIPARIFAQRSSGGIVEVFLVRALGRRVWIAMLRPSRRIRAGEIIFVGKEKHPLRIGERKGKGEWVVTLPASVEEDAFIERYGNMPLPPYIKRSAAPEDSERYQTIFARRKGSVAAPTAGLHFTDDVLRNIRRHGVTVMPLTLHVGPGTFRPLEEETVEKNRLSPEYVMIRSSYLDEILDAKGRGRRIAAVGTTTTRALEAFAAGHLEQRRERTIEGELYITGWTDLFIHPGFEFRVVDALLTNMHLPRSSLLLLTAAFAGRERIIKAYRWAVQRRFRFYSYGDVMFIR